jgi:sensor histidine kinase YesM
MQLNPHFLFNTLHTISALIHTDPGAADRMVAKLSELLRHVLDKTGAQEVPLRQELALVEKYVEIEKTRFQDRLRVDFDIETGVQDALVPCLVLQPLVENAIRHGAEQREDAGSVSIQARQNNGMLELSVSDNGPGLPEREVTPRREGIGLSNTRSRLSHLYGSNCRVDMENAPEGGLRVRLAIPWHTPSQ